MAVVYLSRSVKIVFLSVFIISLGVILGSIVADCDHSSVFSNRSLLINVFNDRKFGSTFDNDFHYGLPAFCNIIPCTCVHNVSPVLLWSRLPGKAIRRRAWRLDGECSLK